MTNHQTRCNRIFASDDVKVCSTNRCERHANDGFTSPGARFVYLFNPNLVLTMENICFHFTTCLACYFQCSAAEMSSSDSAARLCFTCRKNPTSIDRERRQYFASAFAASLAVFQPTVPGP